MTNRNGAFLGISFVLPLLWGLAAASGRDDEPAARPEPRTLVVETPPMHLDQIYHSMQGPYERVPLAAQDVDWITAIRSEVIDAETRARMGNEFFCHSQMQVGSGAQLLVMASGAEEIRLPAGFGVRLTDRERARLGFLGMVLNNHVPDIDRRVRIRATIEYRMDDDVADAPRLEALTMTPVAMTVQSARRSPERSADEADRSDPSDVTTHCVWVGGLPVHWMVPPGPQLTRKRIDVSRWFDADQATVHYIATHMHNYGVSMRLEDVTAGAVLWQADVENEPDRVQIARIPAYSSPDGFVLRRDHEYAIEARYDNTSDHAIDAMAMMGIYWRAAP